MKPQYIRSAVRLKTLFCPECQCCQKRRGAFGGYLCVSCVREILKDFKAAKIDPEVLLSGSFASRRLVGVLREKRYLWAQVIFLKFFRQKFPELPKADWLTTVPQQKKVRPSGLHLFCEALSGELHRPYMPKALRKISTRPQHGAAARTRMDREPFIVPANAALPKGPVLLVDDVETTGTSMLQAETALRTENREIRRLTLVKAWQCEEEKSKHERPEV